MASTRSSEGEPQRHSESVRDEILACISRTDSVWGLVMRGEQVDPTLYEVAVRNSFAEQYQRGENHLSGVLFLLHLYLFSDWSSGSGASPESGPSLGRVVQNFRDLVWDLLVDQRESLSEPAVELLEARLKDLDNELEVYRGSGV